MANMTKKQRELIDDNLKAFIANFGAPRIVKADYGSGFYIYYPADNPNPYSSYIQYCYDINYLNGWLYGVVQGAVRGEFKEVRNDTK